MNYFASKKLFARSNSSGNKKAQGYGKMLRLLKVQQGQTDLEFQREYKKHKKYCSMLIKNVEE